MVNKVPLHFEANEIRNDKTTSFETKEILIDTLKKESGYKKDLELSDEKRSQHREKQAILTKLKTEGQSPEFVDRVRKSFYPGYDKSHKQYKNVLESNSPFAILGLSKEQVQLMKSRNTYNSKYISDEMIDEFSKKISYSTVEKNGRTIHTINNTIFSFPKKDEFTFADMKVDGKCTMDGIKNDSKYKNFATDTGLELLSLDKIYAILGEIATAMNISDTIDYNFFKDNSEKSQGLLQMFRNITGFEGIIILKIKDNGNVKYLDCYDNYCGFDYSNFYNDISDFDEYNYMSFLLGF